MCPAIFFANLAILIVSMKSNFKNIKKYVVGEIFINAGMV